MNALARRDDVFRRPVGKFPDGIAKRAGRVDNDPSVGKKNLSRNFVRDRRAVDFSVVVRMERKNPRVIKEHRALFGGGLRQVYQQARVVKLSVKIQYAA